MKRLSQPDRLAVALTFGVAAIGLVAKGVYGVGAGVVCAAVSIWAGVSWVRHRPVMQNDGGVTWRDLEKRFQELATKNLTPPYKSDGPLCAYQLTGSEGGLMWYVTGGGALRHDAQRLCELAGRKLKASGLAVSERLQRETDDLSRWLFFLVELGQAYRVNSTSMTPEEGYVETYPYKIKPLTEASERACVECMKSEV